MKKILYITLLVIPFVILLSTVLFKIKNNFLGKNKDYNMSYFTEKKLSLKVGDRLTYGLQSTSPYKGKLIEIDTNAEYFAKSVNGPENGMVGGVTTTIFTALKPTSEPTELSIKRYDQEEQKVTVTISK